MNYAQLKEDGTYDRDLPDGNVEFGPRHFQPARTLSDEEKALFRVVSITPTAAPAFDPITQSVQRDGGDLIDGQWRYKWAVTALGAAAIADNQAEAAERTRVAEIAQTVKADAILAQIAGMTTVQYNGFWTGLTAAQKDKVLKLLLLAHANRVQ